MSKLTTTTLWTALLAGASIAHAWEKFEPQVFAPDSPEIRALCESMNNKTGIVLNWWDICEVSMDNGISWQVLAWTVLLAAIWAWALVRFRKKTPTPDVPKDPAAPDTPADGEVDETLDVPPVVVEPEEAPVELVTEESDKTPEEIIVEQAKTDPRFVVDGEVIKSVTIATMKIDDLTKWIPGTVHMPDSRIPMIVYELDKERIEISGTSDGSSPLIITHFADGSDIDRNVTTSYSPIVAEIYDASGVSVWYVPGGKVKWHSRITVDKDGIPTVYDGAKYDDTDTIIEEYDDHWKVKEAPGESPSGISDILAPDTSTPAPAPEAPAPEAPAPEAPAPEAPAPEAPAPEAPAPEAPAPGAPAPDAPAPAPAKVRKVNLRNLLPGWLGWTSTTPSTPVGPSTPDAEKNTDKKWKK
jgi:hypothetical protein